MQQNLKWTTGTPNNAGKDWTTNHPIWTRLVSLVKAGTVGLKKSGKKTTWDVFETLQIMG